MPPKKNRSDRLLTAAELELMRILWRLGEGTVHDVIGQLPKNRPLAYTSVSTLLRILEQKEFLLSRKAGRGHLYIPKIPKEKYETLSLGHLRARVFDHSASSLVQRLIEADDLTREDLMELKALVDGKLNQ